MRLPASEIDPKFIMIQVALSNGGWGLTLGRLVGERPDRSVGSFLYWSIVVKNAEFCAQRERARDGPGQPIRKGQSDSAFFKSLEIAEASSSKWAVMIPR